MRCVVLLMCLAACSAAKGPGAAQEYEIAQRSGALPVELCQRSNKAADAYLSDQDEASYRKWKLTSDIDCLQQSLR